MKIALAISLLASTSFAVQPVDQVDRWQRAIIGPKYTMALDVQMSVFKRNEWRYQRIQNMRPNGVPAPILFCLHYRESDNNFKCSLAQGDPLTHRSRNVPRGRLPDKEPPFAWEDCAEDAVYVVDRLDLVKWNSMQDALWGIEKYNGTGYALYHKDVPAPYLWNGTSIGKPGKYVSDGRFSATAMDQQLGCCAILKKMQASGINLPFINPRPAFRY